MSEAEILFIGQTLPVETYKVLASTGTARAVNLPNQTIAMILDYFRPGDIEGLKAPARFRVSLCKSFLLISPSFKGFKFDIIWSPLIASMPGELVAIQTKPHRPKHELCSRGTACSTASRCPAVLAPAAQVSRPIVFRSYTASSV
jgi:hypothetical protein